EEFQKAEVYSLLLKNGFSSQSFLEKVFNNKEASSEILESIKEGNAEAYPAELFNFIVLNNYKVTPEQILSLDKTLSSVAFEKVLKKLSETKQVGPDSLKYKLGLRWNSTLESINPELLAWVRLNDVPVHSRYRQDYVRRN